jgi:hypothetical protein
MPCIAWVLLIKSVSGKRIARVENINHFAIKFQFTSQGATESCLSSLTAYDIIYSPKHQAVNLWKRKA